MITEREKKEYQLSGDSVSPNQITENLIKDGGDKELQEMFKKFNEQPWKIAPSRFECAKLAATLPNRTLAELQDNTAKIQKWLEEQV